MDTQPPVPSSLTRPGRAPQARLRSPHRGRRPQRTLWAVSDLHIHARGNADLVRAHVTAASPHDWLIVAGDVAEEIADVIAVLSDLKERFEQVIFTPGNHELYSRSTDTVRGKAKYKALIRACQAIGVLTPEDGYPVFAGHTIVPMFTLYDHTWREAGTTQEEALREAEEHGVVLNDHFSIAPFVDIPLWCRERLAYTVRRLAKVSGPTILVNHWPLVREAMEGVFYQDIALWSGTRHTEHWPQRYRATRVIYGHLHIPREIFVRNVTHAEVSLGYPRESSTNLPPRLAAGQWPYPVLTEEVST